MPLFFSYTTQQDKPGHGSARPFARFAKMEWAAPLVAPRFPSASGGGTSEAPATTTTATVTTKNAAKIRPAPEAFFRVPLWEDVDEQANEMDGCALEEVSRRGQMPPYDSFFQFA